MSKAVDFLVLVLVPIFVLVATCWFELKWLKLEILDRMLRRRSTSKTFAPFEVESFYKSFESIHDNVSVIEVVCWSERKSCEQLIFEFIVNMLVIWRFYQPAGYGYWQLQLESFIDVVVGELGWDGTQNSKAFWFSWSCYKQNFRRWFLYVGEYLMVSANSLFLVKKPVFTRPRVVKSKLCNPLLYSRAPGLQLRSVQMCKGRISPPDPSVRGKCIWRKRVRYNKWKRVLLLWISEE